MLSDFSGREWKRYEFDRLPVRTRCRVEIALPPLSKGAYVLTCRSEAGAETMAVEEYFRIRDPQQCGVEFLPGNRMTLNGEPFFPIGFTTGCAWREFGHFAVSEDALRIYREMGLNALCVQDCTASDKDARFVNDIAEKYGFAIFNWNNLGDWTGTSEEIDAKLRENFAAAKLITNFAGFLDDESMWRGTPLGQLQHNYRRAFELASDYVLWQNFASRIKAGPELPKESAANFRRFVNTCDVTGGDIYPVPPEHVETLNSVGGLTTLIRERTDPAKPVWMILQRFGWSEMIGPLNDHDPRPNYHQLRFMVYNALTHGASGIFWHGEGPSIGELYTPYMATLADVNWELAAVTDIWKTGTDSTRIGDYPEIRIMKIENADATVYVFVNESATETREFDPGLSGEITPLYVSPTGVPREPGPVRLEPNGVLILSTVPIKIEPVKPFEPGMGTQAGPVSIDAVWIAHPDYANLDGADSIMTREFDLPHVDPDSSIRICGDDSWKLIINDVPVREGWGHKRVHEIAIAQYLHPGVNTIVVRLHNNWGASGIIFALRSGDFVLRSDSNCQFTDANGANAKPAKDLGGIPSEIWGVPDMLFSNLQSRGTNETRP